MQPYRLFWAYSASLHRGFTSPTPSMNLRIAILDAYSLCVLSSIRSERPSLARIPSIISLVIVESGITTLFSVISHLFGTIRLFRLYA